MINKIFKHKVSWWAITAVMIICVSGCDKSPKWHYATGSTWGTIYNIKYLSDKDLSDSIVSRMKDIDMSLSPFQPASLISQINNGADIEVDDLFCDVFYLSQRVCSISDGLFDPTVAPIVNLWGFGYKNAGNDTPTQAQIDSARSSVGIRACAIDESNHLIKKSTDTEFNFSAIAKGYGVDLVAETLRRNGCTDFMVEIGGEVALSGKNPSGEKWRIQIDAPVEDQSEISHTRLDVLQLSDACIATSGNYRNHHATADGEVGHTLSPITGYPIATTTLSATIVAPSTALADALATAVMAMPDSAALSMLSAIDDVEALIVKGNDDGSYKIITTPGFDRLLK